MAAEKNFHRVVLSSDPDIEERSDARGLSTSEMGLEAWNAWICAEMALRVGVSGEMDTRGFFRGPELVNNTHSQYHVLPCAVSSSIISYSPLKSNKSLSVLLRGAGLVHINHCHVLIT